MKTRRFNSAYVVVEPETRHLWASGQTEERMVSICEDIIGEIKHHVDDVASAYVEKDIDVVCEHCGAIWTEDGLHNGGCCAPDADYMEAHDPETPPFHVGDIVRIKGNDHLGEHRVDNVEWYEPGKGGVEPYWLIETSERREPPDLSKYPPGTTGIIGLSSHSAISSAYELVERAKDDGMAGVG